MILGILGLAAFAAGGYGFKKLNDYAGDSLGRDKTCPCCGQKGLRKVGTSGFYVNGKLQSEWKCMQCGKKYTTYS